jgi:transposase
MTKSEADRTFGVSRSSVKRYAKLAEEGPSLAPKKRPGSKLKMDERATKLLEADAHRRPAATLSERRQLLQNAAGVRASDSTVSRMLRRLGWGRKKVGGCERERRVLEGGLEDVGRWGDLRRAAGVRRRDAHQHLACAPLRVVTPRAKSVSARTWRLKST